VSADDLATRGIDYFNREHPLQKLKIKVALAARRRMYERVLTLARPTPTTRILDVGTTPDVDLPYNNFFERWYPYPDRVTACSIEDCSNLESHFPGVSFRRIVDDRLPFDDRQFDVALSFAVLEHVGSESRQKRFVDELARVSNCFVLYTPYRFFPVEMHTFLPFTHWLPPAVHRPFWRVLGLQFWADEKNLNLLSVRSAIRLLPRDGKAKLRFVWTMGLPSNLEIYWRRSE
jgi:hypothetical protein